MERAQSSSDGGKKPILVKLVLVGKLGVGKSGMCAEIARDRVFTLLNFLALFEGLRMCLIICH